MSFKVLFQPQGVSIDVDENENILDAVLRQGYSLPYGCRSAMCGSCKVSLIEGEVDYNGIDVPGLTDEDRRLGGALLCHAKPRSDLRIEAENLVKSGNFEIQNIPVRVVRLEKLTPDVMQVMLKPASAIRFHYFAGQYIDIVLKDGRRRSFSIANSPDNNSGLIELHIRHVPGGEYTAYVFDEMRLKDMIRISGPYGFFYLREETDRPIVLVAGGTGFGPIKSIVEYAFERGIKRPIHLYWGVRSKVDIYLDRLVSQWLQHENYSYTPVLSEPKDGDHWPGKTGYVHEAVIQDYSDMSGLDVYAAGPPPMINEAKIAFADRGLPDERFFYDSFDYAQDNNSV